jgi:hypothetical protein
MPPKNGATILNYTGHGNRVTSQFTVPDSGNYIVSWSYSGNSGGYGADNFNISLVGSQALALGLPNDIATSGSGTTEVTGDSGLESFNVQAEGSATWSIKVLSA